MSHLLEHNHRFSNEQLLKTLYEYWGYTSFKNPQQEIIQSVLNKKDVLVLLATGGGKSLCYQLPTLLLKGVCIVISPLVALIKNQVEELQKRNIDAVSINRQMNYNEIVRVFDNLQFGKTSFLYLSPERLQSELIQEKIKQLDVSLIAIDEAHCISEWGHDFRSSYLKLNVLRELKPKTPIIALTATATQRVLSDIEKYLNLQKPAVFKTSFQRKNIVYKVINAEHTYPKLLQILQKTTEPCIIYAQHRRQTQQLSDFLNKNGYKASFYHGGLSANEKNDAYELWMTEKTPIMVATNAFGMGIDKANVRTVIHINIPRSLENFVQESGRAGRDGKISNSYLITSKTAISDAKKRFLINTCDIAFIKKIYNHLNQYYRVAFGELPEEPFLFYLQEFCRLYKLPIVKSYNAISILEREGVISVDNSFQKKSNLKFLINENDIFDYTHHPAFGSLIQLVLRSYGGVFSNFCSIDEYKLSRHLKVTKSTVIKSLKKLNEQNVIKYNHQNTAAKLYFLMPREDDYTINRISRHIDQQNKLKKQKFDAVISYINADAICRNVQILSYFDEENTKNCELCDCCQKKAVSKVSYSKIADDILRILKINSESSNNLTSQLPYDEVRILKTLQLLLENHKISLNSQHKFQIQK